MSNQDYDNTNKGMLGKADKGDNPKRPDYKGQIDVDGVEYWLSGWIREARSGRNAGRKFISLNIQPKDKPKERSNWENDRAGQGQRGQERRQDTPEDGEDVPF